MVFQVQKIDASVDEVNQQSAITEPYITSFVIIMIYLVGKMRSVKWKGGSSLTKLFSSE